jgi:nitroreductase
MSAVIETIKIKRAQTDYPIHEFIKSRWSPYVFSDKKVTAEDLRSLFEAARWAPSCYNEQPWYYIMAFREDTEEFEKMLSCLSESNQKWARQVPVLGLGIARTTFDHNGKTNRHAFHDLGQASAVLTVEATSRGIHVHQMAGIIPDRARELYGLPENAEAVTGIAIGYVADLDDAPEKFRKNDHTPRRRRPARETVFGGRWGKTNRVFEIE